MTRPRIAIGTLGGTITMTAGAGGGVAPTLGAQDLLDAVPGLGSEVELVSETLARRPGASLTPADIVAAVEWAREAVADGCSGVVLVQGTDTLPETAFLADLYWDRPEPLIFTGAMRPPSALSADGPANLADACRVAGARVTRGLGVTVVLDQQVHLARRVAKSHAWQLHAFTSGPLGVAGLVREGNVEIVAGPRPDRLTMPRPQTDPDVPVWTTYLGDTGRGLAEFVEAGAAGLVIDAFGVGHVPERVAQVLDEVVQQIPVVVTSSTDRGGTFERTYAFAGSETDLLQRGVLPGGQLPARKARLLLWAWLAAGRELDDSDLAAAFAQS